MVWKRGVETGVKEGFGSWGGRGVWRLGRKRTEEAGVETEESRVSSWLCSWSDEELTQFSSEKPMVAGSRPMQTPGASCSVLVCFRPRVRSNIAAAWDFYLKCGFCCHIPEACHPQFVLEVILTEILSGVIGNGLC